MRVCWDKGVTIICFRLLPLSFQARFQQLGLRMYFRSVCRCTTSISLPLLPSSQSEEFYS